jgi:hypothetical protein
MKKLFLTGLVFVGFALAQAPETTVHAADTGRVDMYRMYNPNSGEHFYTGSRNEAQSLAKVGWHAEGIGFTAPAKSSTPVYRLYNANAGDHHYTTDANEKDSLVKVGWKYEGIGWYSSDAKKVQVLRAYNPNAKAGSHNYTTNAGEQRNLISAGWRDEGVAWYAIEAGKSTSNVTSTNDNQNSNMLKLLVGVLQSEFSSENFDDEFGSVNVEEGDNNTIILNVHMKYAVPGVVELFKEGSEADMREAIREISPYIPNMRIIVNVYNPGNVLAGSFIVQ